MAFLVKKALFRWNECSKNADITVLSNFLEIFFKFFSRYREILPSTIHMPNFRSIGPFKQKLQEGGGGGGRESALPRPYQSVKSSACLGLSLSAASIFVTEGLFIYIYFLLFDFRAEEKISPTISLFFRKMIA